MYKSNALDDEEVDEISKDSPDTETNIKDGKPSESNEGNPDSENRSDKQGDKRKNKTQQRG